MQLTPQQLKKWLIFMVAFAAAVVLESSNTKIGRGLIWSMAIDLAATAVIMALVAVWGASLRRRIVQRRSSSLIGIMFFLLELWLLLRGVKYDVFLPLGKSVFVENIKRYIWYCYYIPMLGLPALLSAMAILSRKPESYKLPKAVLAVLFAGYILLVVAVLTNDFHQLVFTFPKGAAVFSDREYGYSYLYYLCVIWAAGCMLAAVVIMAKKYRLPKHRRMLWLPLVPIALWAGYGIAYLTDNTGFYFDITIVDCFALMALFETSVTVGLIPSNLHYVELFEACDISAVITDKNLVPVYAAKSAVVPQKNLLEQAVERGSVTENGMRISAYPIEGGYAFWRDDMTELTETNEELWEIRRELEEQYSIAREKFATYQTKQSLTEKNRLYNLMQNETQGKIKELYDLANALENTDDEGEIHRITARLAVLCAYVKRRNNLLFIRESNSSIEGAELAYCIRESLDNMALLGIETDVKVGLNRALSFFDATKIYDAFETAVETVLYSTSELFVSVFEKENSVSLRMNLVCGEDICRLSQAGFVVENEGEGEWSLAFDIARGGARE